MNASEKNLLAETDQMTESTLIRMEDWKIAHLRVAMLHHVEQTLNETVAQDRDDSDHPGGSDQDWRNRHTEATR